MKRWTTVVVALVLVALTASPGASQEMTDEQRALRTRIEDRYDIVPLTGGIALRPKTRTRDIRLIEIADGVIAINGVPVSGQELKERLGEDAQAVLRLSYLPADQRRAIFGGSGQSASPRRNGNVQAEDPAPPRRARRSDGQRVRIFGDVTVNENEEVGGEVVAVLGSVQVNGEVGREVVAVLGSVDLGPKAVVHGDVVSVGGRVRRSPGSQILGGVTEVSIGGLRVSAAPWLNDIDIDGFGFHGLPRLLGSTFRMMLLGLLTGIVLVLARGSVERSTERVLDNPPKAVFVGLAAELLVVPVFVLTAIVLMITIIGIPLLLLLPFAVLMLLLAALVGFAGTAAAIGQAARQRFGIAGRAAFFDICLGILIILSPLLVGRFLGLAGWPANPFAWLLILTGTAFEFLAWTTGFGAVLINTFSRWRARRIARTVPPAATA